MKAILTDVTRCIGCERCVTACNRENQLGRSPPFRWLVGDGLAADRYTSVIRHEGLFVRKQCRHCLEPACASVCPVGAFSRTPEGAVVYDFDRCIGCRYCMMACPFGVPRYDWLLTVPQVRKCTLCQKSRLDQGLPPACTEACPVQATIFGERDDLLAEAHRRIVAEPGKYLSRVIGETDAGGTGVLYLSPVELDVLPLGNRIGNTSVPSTTLDAMMAVPPVFVAVGGLMGGIWWVIERRRRRAAEATRHRAGDDPKDGGVS